MSLWSNLKKPSWLSEKQKENCHATSRGWVLKRPNGMEELLVSIPNLDKMVEPEVKKPVITEPKKEKVVKEEPVIIEEEPKVEPEVKEEPVIIEEEPKVEPEVKEEPRVSKK